MKPSLDLYDMIPHDQRAYLSNYGWHFNKKACDYAVKRMRKFNPATGKMERLEPWTAEQVNDLLKRYGVNIEHNTLQDVVFVANMAKADFFKSSLPDESHVAMWVKDYMDDIDAGDGFIMRRWFATMISNGEPVEWSEIL